MQADYVFPNNNEEEFIQIASKLGYTYLYFIYDPKDIDKAKLKIESLQPKTKIKLETGAIANINTINKAKKHTKTIIVKSSEYNRPVLEKYRNIIIFNLEDSPKKDFIHHRASGLNQVLCKLANKNSIIVGFSSNMILKSTKKSLLMGRINQNIRLCEKYKVEVIIGSFAKEPYEMKAPKDLQSLYILLGKN